MTTLGALLFFGAWLVLILLWRLYEPPKASVYMRLRPGRLSDRERRQP
jgi:hypothetical protein